MLETGCCHAVALGSYGGRRILETATPRRAGDWILETGDWRLDAGDWRLDAGCWMLDVLRLRLFSAFCVNRIFSTHSILKIKFLRLREKNTLLNGLGYGGWDPTS